MSALDAAVLGECSARRFFARHWQKTPLLVRAALPGFADVVSAAQLAGLACRDDAQSRLVIRRARRWEAHQGPLDPRLLRRLPARGWTLLVHEVDHFFPQARGLLERFSFIPYARLDDLMVSYAAPGGGVGPHCDSYDVFLLQGAGRRRWRVGHQRDAELVEGAPLKLLRNFRPQREWILEPGDMLYLPPGWAHEGVALEAAMTYSIGFRAPQWHELAVHFLRFLEDRVALDGLYRDPDLTPQAQPARIAPPMVRKVAQRLESIRWSTPQIARFLGEYLTEPKPHVFFRRRRRSSLTRFAESVRRSELSLDLRSQMLYFGHMFFINGETVQVRGRARESLSRLADTRRLSAVDTTQRGLVALLHEWYGAGYLNLRATARPTSRSER